MSGRFVVGFGLAALALVGGVLLYLLKTSESVKLPPADAAVASGAGGRPAPVFPRVRKDAFAEANVSRDAGAAGAAAFSDATGAAAVASADGPRRFMPSRLVPNRAARLPGPAQNAQ